MKINREIIRGYDIRGIVDKDLSAEIIEKYGKAYGTFLIRNNKKTPVVVLGHDSRATSEEYSDAMARGIASTGLNVVDTGLNLVGTIYWAQYHFNTQGAVMITASHNPREYNGFKMAVDLSESMIKDGLLALTDTVDAEDFETSETPGEIKKEDIRKVYFDTIIKHFNISKKFKVVVDSSCTTAGVIAPDLLRQVGCDVVENNCELDSTFPLGVADPIEKEVVERLAKKVLEVGADIGFTYDPDGDRIGVVDEKGMIIWNDVLVALFATDILNYHPGEKIMYNTLCSKVVDETIKAHGGEPFMWRTGHGFLKKKNQEVKAPFIGELSGHFFFSADFYNHDDGLYATLRLLDYLSRTGKTLHEEVEALPKYISSPEIKIGIADAVKREVVAKISEELKKDRPDAEIIDDERAGDGVRLELADGMFIVRYSQNGPYMTVKFEHQTEEGYEELRLYIKNLLHKFEEIDWSRDNALNVNIESLDK